MKCLRLKNKPKKDLTMITVEECLLFAEWLQDRYYKIGNTWLSRRANDPAKYTTRQLWEAYNRFLGAKPANPKDTAP